MSVEMSAGVLVAEMLEGMKFALGPTMVVRRDSLDEAGGFRAVGPYHADDFMLGNLISASGLRVELSTHTIEHHVLNSSFLASVLHQIRWMKSTRFSRPKGHFGTALTFSMPYGLVAAGVALSFHRPLLGAMLLLWSWTSRAALGALVGRLVVAEPRLLRSALLYPVRDLLGFCYWVASYVSSRCSGAERSITCSRMGSCGMIPKPPRVSPKLFLRCSWSLPSSCENGREHPGLTSWVILSPRTGPVYIRWYLAGSVRVVAHRS